VAILLVLGVGGGGVFGLEFFELADEAEVGVAEVALVAGVGEEGIGGGIGVEGFGEGEAGRIVVALLREGVELALGVVGALETPEDGGELVEEVVLEGSWRGGGLAEFFDEDVVGGGAFGLGRVGDWEQRPCLREFWEDLVLPEGVRGPVDFWELRRLAASLRGESLGRLFGARSGRRMLGDFDFLLPGADERSSIKAILLMKPLPKRPGERCPPYEFPKEQYAGGD
jgi:hypothetical protein